MIVIVDYGMGNLASVANAFYSFGEDVLITSDREKVLKASGVVLPGVGACGDAMKNLKGLSLDSAILDFISSGRPFMGICLGMQLLFERSYENGEHKGLGVLRGEVLRFNVDLPVPHMGWNDVRVVKESPFLNDIEDGSYFYFDHSYYVEPYEKNIIGLECEYGIKFPAAIVKENVFGVQFHPEKSYKKGLKLLKNFINIVKR
ncbi:MAG: imidazole glycerol phosphate synthase subunit HisH [Brevinematia bacterium]